MSIDFHSKLNRHTYDSRDASADWVQAVTQLVEPDDRRIADVGCGGGIYSEAWLNLGAQAVFGIDFSAQMVAAAKARLKDYPQASISQGDACATGLPADCVDVVFERALIHHLDSYEGCFAEAKRLLAPGGLFLIQDRTPADVEAAASTEHLRGYFFECFPRLLEIERGRRPESVTVENALRKAGFTQITTRTVWETRKTYGGFDELARDLAARTGRSILHELSDSELQKLIAYIQTRLPDNGPIVEKDRWTLWASRSMN
ncbi:class I SAM-dependent methyltransferase [Paraburkholderia sp.]|uniref:class I SAM-dependent methyltransferase n=1 Tax=Paraburkholderia sp. TaxID=1926495 RepID=UPI0039E6ACD4